MSYPKEFIRIQGFLRVIANPLRLKILFYLKNDTRCVSEMQKEFRIPQNLVSYHLKVLKNIGLVTAQRKGVGMHYQIDKKTLSKYRNIFHSTFEMDRE